MTRPSHIEPLLLAGLTISCIPVIVLFLLFQRNLLGGLSAGAVKGGPRHPGPGRPRPTAPPKESR